MAIVAACAGSFAIYGAFSRAYPYPLGLSSMLGLVVLYDLLIYFVLRAIRRLVSPRAGERPTLLLVVIAVLVLATCAGLPLLVLTGAFLGIMVG